jgi:hypothetical protein
MVDNEKKASTAETIWNDIKDRNIDMFALSGAKVSDYCKPVEIDPSRCFLLFKASAVLPALEAAVAGKYDIEIADRYIIVSKAKGKFGV